MTPPAEMKLPLRLDAVHEDLIVDAENCVCFRVVGQSKWPSIILGAVNRHADLVEALRELFAAAEWYRLGEGHEDAYARWIRAEEAVKALASLQAVNSASEP